jgi:hypothetical protein
MIHRSCQHRDICAILASKYNNYYSKLLDCQTCSDHNYCNTSNLLKFSPLVAIILFTITKLLINWLLQFVWNKFWTIAEYFSIKWNICKPCAIFVVLTINKSLCLHNTKFFYVYHQNSINSMVYPPRAQLKQRWLWNFSCWSCCWWSTKVSSFLVVPVQTQFF